MICEYINHWLPTPWNIKLSKRRLGVFLKGRPAHPPHSCGWLSGEFGADAGFEFGLLAGSHESEFHWVLNLAPGVGSGDGTWLAEEVAGDLGGGRHFDDGPLAVYTPGVVGPALARILFSEKHMEMIMLMAYFYSMNRFFHQRRLIRSRYCVRK